MIDSPSTDAAAPAQVSDAATAAPPPRRARGLLWALLWLLLMAAIAGAGWLLYQQQLALDRQSQLLRRVSQNVQDLRQQAEQLDLRQADLAAAAQRNSGELASFGERISGHDELVGRLQEQLAGGRSRFQLAAVEHVLMLANDRLQLARDVNAALRAVQEADERLAALRDPRLFNVRQALAEERTALMQVPDPDIPGTVLRLSSLSARIDRLPLRARTPEHFEPLAPPAESGAPAAEDGPWARLQAAVRQTLNNLFTLRRREGPPVMLLAPQQEALVYQVLLLRIEAARVALLRNDTAAFREACAAAARWLQQYFRVEDVSVQTALAEFERLQTLELDPPLPEVSRSLTLLRGHMDEREP